MSIRISGHATGIAALLWTVFTGTSVFAANATDLPLPNGCEIAAHRAGTEAASKALTPAFPPIQLQIRTPVEPTVFASAGRNYLIYELHLQNFASDPLTLRSIEVIDINNGIEKPIAEFKEAHLKAVLRPIGIDEIDDYHRVKGGQSMVAFLCLAFDSNAAVPGKLRHRVLLENDVADGSVIDVHRAPLPVLGRPLIGTDWNPRNGPNIESHHRTGLLVAGGLAQISRRYAIDWRKSKNGTTFSGDARDVHSYYAYGEKVLAVADGTVVVAKDGLPDNIPRTEAGFETAVAMNMETVAGNTVVIALGDGQFASYSHLLPGSVRFKQGDRVQRGQLLGRVGNSGDARWPHLHFQVTSNPNIIASEGSPFVIDQFRMKVAGKEWMTRTKEFPWGDEVVIDFGAD